MTDQETAERLVEVLLARLRDVGSLLASEIDKVNERVTVLEDKLDALDARMIARAEGRQP